jgi:hypothetical protein
MISRVPRLERRFAAENLKTNWDERPGSLKSAPISLLFYKINDVR